MIQEQPSVGVIIKNFSENMQQIYRGHSCRSVISKLQSDFAKITFRHDCSPVNLLHIFRTAFRKNTAGGLLFTIIHYFHII